MSKLIIIRGPSGSGKSTLSKSFVQGLKGNWVVIPKDILSHDFYFSNKKKYGRNNALSVLVRDCLCNKVNVVVDGIFGGNDLQDVISFFKRLAMKEGADFFVITLNVSLKKAHERNKNRTKPIPKRDVDKWYKYFYDNIISEGLILDNDFLTEKKAIEKIKGYLKA